MNEVTAILSKYSIRPQKSFGQNFLIDKFYINKIIDAADAADSVVLEIGGGVGSLTQGLLEKAKRVIVVEIDSKMCEILEKEYGSNPKLELINSDILKVDVAALWGEETGNNIKVCANLPYYITTPILMHLLENVEGISKLTLMMQKEVADRILAKPNTKDYGAITPAVNYYTEVSMVTHVPPNCFLPRPTVDSTVLSFSVLEKKPVSPIDEKLMFAVIKSAFGQRRKTMLNALSNQLLPNLGISKDSLLQCFTEAGIAPSQRGETLSLKEFCLLSDKIAKSIPFQQ